MAETLGETLKSTKQAQSDYPFPSTTGTTPNLELFSEHILLQEVRRSPEISSALNLRSLSFLYFAFLRT